MVLFNSYLFAQDFLLEYRGNRIRDTNRGLGESWAEVGSPWARPNPWVGWPKGGPSDLVLFVCVAHLGVVCCLGYGLLPHTGFLPAILFKNIWKQNKTLLV